jgi:hypothetical protein
MTADLVRFATLLLGALLIGLLAATYYRAWRFAIPQWTVRAVAVSIATNFAAAMGIVASRIGEPLNWYSPVIGGTFLCTIGGVFRLWRWFYTEDGRRVRHAMVAEYAARDLVRLAARMQREEDLLARARESASRQKGTP